MRKPLVIAIFSALVAGAPYVAAQTPSKPEGKFAASAMDMDKQMAQMQENIKRMQQQMDRIHQAKDPKERHELMDEHSKTMQENMQMMRGMGGPMMMDMMQMMRHQQMMRFAPAKSVVSS